ncbi:head GIN domain-containing protein [Flammeovirga sp. OC4]|uniref:head GIN domain-containing protein n=1 Tax=Flammeovirga sp. OC4 TaxID=1382345 RepID=UPI0005C6CF57|nr:head GIN domain-containing protein [Flammeovirga sp. OC4]
MRNLILILLSSIVLFSSCNISENVAGSPKKTFDLDIEETITGIELNVAGEVVIDQSDNQSATVVTQQEVMDHLSYNVSNGVLIIDFEKNFKNYDFKLYLNVATLNRVNVNGSGKAVVYNLNADELALKIAGSGDIVVEDASHVANTIDLKLDGSGNINVEKISTNTVTATRAGSGDISLYGTNNTLNAKLDGSGDLNADQLISKDVSVTNSGSGNVHVHCDGVLYIRNSGSGTVKVGGNPTSIL